MAQWVGTDEREKDRDTYGPDVLCNIVQVLPDRDGKRCMFCLKTISKSYEMSASDTRQRQEWTSGLCFVCCVFDVLRSVVTV